ncbi:MAG: DNA internalization-related competence protein ComEC/Rec2 [Anaeroplasmataceae bacterium]
MKSQYNNIHFLVIPPLLIGLSFKYIIFVIPLIIYLIYIIKKRILVKPILILSSIFLCLFFIYNNYKTTIKNSFNGVVIEHKDNKYVLLSGMEFIIVYSNEEFKVGDKLNISGDKSYISSESYKYGFSYKDYLATKRIYNIYKNPKIEYLKHYHTISGLKDNMINYFKSKVSDTSYNYLLTLTLGYNMLDDTEEDNISSLGITHLFCISGFHVNLMYMALYYLLSKLTNKEGLKGNIISIFFIFYILLTGFSISILRSSIMIIISTYKEKYNRLYTPLDVLSFSCLIVLFINPLYLYQTAFILTYLITFFLIIGGNITKSDNKKITVFKTTLLAFFSSLPIIININGSINLLSIIFVPIFTIIVGYFLLPLSFIMLVFPILSKLKIFEIFDLIINILSKIKVFNISISYINIYFVIIYYIFFILFLIMLENARFNKKLVLISFIYLLFIINIKYLNPYYHITMIDVGQGDSILIRLPNNKGNMLIDSFGYNINYLKYLGIDSLDYLVLTHSDSDHIKTALEVINKFKVKEIYTSYYDNIDFSTKKIKSGDSFYLGDIKIDVLGPINNDSLLNNNSLVLKMKIYNYTFLETGDIEYNAEMDLIKKYGNKLKSDILKVAHHGSDSSSNKEFINYVDPKISLISVGNENKYGFPSRKVLDVLKKSDIYRTDINGNIDIKISKTGIKVNHYR